MSNKWKYEILIYWSEEEQAYLAEVPELPDCIADGVIVGHSFTSFILSERKHSSS